MPLDQIIGSIPFLFLKVVFVIGLIFHLMFAIILLRQTMMMVSVVESEASSVIFSIAVVHLLVSIFVLLWALLFL